MPIRRDILPLGLLALVFLLHALWLWDPAYLPVDDAYITFRYSHNLLNGWGYAFNPGSVHVEGLNNHFWIWLGLLPEALGLDTPLLAAWAGWASALIAAAWIALRQPMERGPRRWLPTFLLALWSPNLIWSLGGLETATYGLSLLGLSFWMAQPPFTWRGRVLAGLFLIALPLMRPEGVLMSGAAGLWMMVRRWHADRWRAGLPLAMLAAGMLAVTAWRLATFGFLYPNTYYVKMYFTPLAERWAGGASYLLGFFNDSGAWLLLPFWLLSVRVASAQALLLGIGLASVIHTGGDWMGHYRFCMPLMPLMALMAGEGLEQVIGRWKAASAAAASPLRWLLLALPMLGVVAWSAPASIHFRAQPVTWIGWHRATGKWLDRHAPAGTRIFLHDAGSLPYYAPGFVVLDGLRLTDPQLGHRPDMDPIDLITRERPELVVVHPIHAPRDGDPRLADYVAVEGWGAPLELPPELASQYPAARGLRMLRVRKDLVDATGAVRLPTQIPTRPADEDRRTASQLCRDAISIWQSGGHDAAIERLEEARRRWPSNAWIARRLEQIRLHQHCLAGEPNGLVERMYESYRLPWEARCAR